MIRFGMRCFFLGLVVVGLLSGAARGEEALEDEQDQTFYALGALMGRGLNPFNFTPAELDVFYRGMRDQVLGAELAVDIHAYQAQIQALQAERREQAAALEAAAEEAFLEAVASEEGVVRFESGLLYDEKEEGSGASPEASSTVRVHYRGTLRSGREFDSSYSRGQPAEFPLDRVIACWTEGLQKMKVGGKARLVCPGKIAYGPTGHPPSIPGNAVLSFDVELLAVDP